MIITPHLLLGAVIGVKIKHFGWIIVLGILSHVILDKIPHWAYGKGVIKKFSKSKSYKILFIFFLQLMIDGFVGLLIVMFIIRYKNMLKLEYLIPISIGIFAAILPDILLGIFNLSYVKIKKPPKNFIDFYRDTVHHVKKHIKKPNLAGLGPQILISLIAALILLL